MATKIYNVYDLQNIKNDLSGDYELANDIDASVTQSWNGGLGFEPLGSGNEVVVNRLPISDIESSGPWNVYPGGSKYEQVDDGVGISDDDSTYIESNQVNAYVIFGIDGLNIPTDSQNINVRLYYRCKRTASYPEFAPMLRIGGSNYTIDDETSFPSSWGWCYGWIDNPVDPEGEWKPADLANLHGIGAKITYNSGSGYGRFSTIYLVVTYRRLFAGNFDGKGHSISNLFINRPTQDYVGLFGYTGASDNQGIRNVKLINANVTGNTVVASLAGLTTHAIENCSSSGTVAGKGAVGGLIGTNSSAANMKCCFSTCIVNGIDSGYSAGGLCAQSLCGIEKCFTSGEVNAPAFNQVGGLIGSAGLYSYRQIKDSYAASKVTGNSRVGGLIGSFNEKCDYEQAVINCYSVGKVLGNTYVGGLIGYRYDYPPKGTVTSCFWDIETSGQTTSDGGTGKTTAQLKARSTFTSAGWDIAATNTSRNDGYPFLAWELGKSGTWLIYEYTPPPLSPRNQRPVQDKVTLEAIRNIEVTAGGRFFIDREGRAVYRSRYARNK